MDVSSIPKPGNGTNKTILSIMKQAKSNKASERTTGLNPVIMNMLSGSSENFLNYMKELDLAKSQNLMVLSSGHRYYYDETDLRSVKTVLNLEKLNFIRHIDRFLVALVRILPPDSNFIGCFAENAGTEKRDTTNSELSKGLLDRIKSFIFREPEHYMDKNKVSDLFENHGFRILDMKEINGITYFHSRNVKRKDLA